MLTPTPMRWSIHFNFFFFFSLKLRDHLEEQFASRFHSPEVSNSTLLSILKIAVLFPVGYQVMYNLLMTYFHQTLKGILLRYA